MKTLVRLWSYLAEFFLEREMFRTNKSCRETQQHTSYSVTFFPDSRAIYELMWKNTVEMDKPQITICNTAHALCMLGNLGQCFSTAGPRPGTGP